MRTRLWAALAALLAPADGQLLTGTFFDQADQLVESCTVDGNTLKTLPSGEYEAVENLPQCLPVDASQATGLGSFNFDETANIYVHVSRWSSARAAAMLAYIILKERLGFPNVKLVQADASDPRTYEYLAKEGCATMNVELYPALKKVEYAAASAERSQFEGASAANMISTGVLGYEGRSGWYTSNATLLAHDLIVNFTNVARMDTLSRGMWGSLVFLYSEHAHEHFIHSDEVPASIIYTGSTFNPELYRPQSNISIAHGTFSGPLGTWTPNDGRCCGRAASLSNSCPAGSQKCIALINFSPSYDVGYNEKLVHESGLPIEIVYASRTADYMAALDHAASVGKSLLFYFWEPSQFFLPSNPHSPFVRLAGLPYEYCRSRLDGTVQTNTIQPHGIEACDFPFQLIDKHANRLVKVSNMLKNFVDNYQLTYEEMMQLVTGTSYGNWTSFHEASCAFLRQKPDFAEAFQPDIEALPIAVPVVLLILVIFAVWQTEIQGLVARLANAVRSCATKRPSMLTTSSVHHVKKEDEEEEEDTADVGAVARQKTRTKDTPACASITIAEHEVVVTEQAGRVDIVVLQVDGDISKDIQCKVSVVPFTALYERDYGPLCVSCVDGQNNIVKGDQGTDGQAGVLNLKAGTNTGLITIPILPYFGYSSGRFFLVRIEPPPDVDCHIAESVVRIVNVHTFPNNMPIEQTLDRKKRWTIIYNFLIEAHRERWGEAGKHLFAQFLSAGIAGIASPTMYGLMIDSFSSQKRFNFSLFAGLLQFALWVFNDYYLSQFFDGSYGVRLKLQRQLTRKFLSLSDYDMEKYGHVAKEEFRQAIQNCAPKLASQCYGGFHSLISAFFSVIFSLLFLIFVPYLKADNRNANIELGFDSAKIFTTIFNVILPLTLIPVFGFVGLMRISGSSRLTDIFLAKDVKLQETLTFTLSSRPVIRSCHREGRATMRLEGAYDELGGTGYSIWLYDRRTNRLVTHSLLFIQYLLWVLAPVLTLESISTSQFIVLLGALSTAGSSIFGLVQSILSVLTSAAYIRDVAKLLNMRTSQQSALLSNATLGGTSDSKPQGMWASMRAKKSLSTVVKTAFLATSMDESRMEEIKRIKESFESRGTQAFEFKMPSYTGNYDEGTPIFTRLKLMGYDVEREDPITSVKGGGIIRLRVADAVEHGSTFAERAELVLMKLLVGENKSSDGTGAGCFPTLRAELILQNSVHQLSTLSIVFNLLYGLIPERYYRNGILRRPSDGRVGAAGPYVPTERELWDLCHMVGVSAAVIWPEYREGWSSLELSQIMSWVSDEDLSKLALARALLRKPDVLLLYRVGDSWSPHGQETLLKVIRAYMKEGKLPWDTEPEKGVRTVLWSTDNNDFTSKLSYEADLQLELHSPEKAVLKPFGFFDA